MLATHPPSRSAYRLSPVLSFSDSSSPFSGSHIMEPLVDYFLFLGEWRKLDKSYLMCMIPSTWRVTHCMLFSHISSKSHRGPSIWGWFFLGLPSILSYLPRIGKGWLLDSWSNTILFFDPTHNLFHFSGSSTPKEGLGVIPCFWCLCSLSKWWHTERTPPFQCSLSLLGWHKLYLSLFDPKPMPQASVPILRPSDCPIWEVVPEPILPLSKTISLQTSTPRKSSNLTSPTALQSPALNQWTNSYLGKVTPCQNTVSPVFHTIHPTFSIVPVQFSASSILTPSVSTPELSLSFFPLDSHYFYFSQSKQPYHIEGTPCYHFLVPNPT